MYTFVSFQKGLWRMVEDITKQYTRWAVAFALLLMHTLITFLLPVPGCPMGYLGPAGLHEDNAYGSECVGGATGYIDRQILTADHIYQGGPANQLHFLIKFGSLFLHNVE